MTGDAELDFEPGLINYPPARMLRWLRGLVITLCQFICPRRLVWALRSVLGLEDIPRNGSYSCFLNPARNC